MACKFKLYGRTFDSELALDDFLMLNKKLYSKYGDVVFLSTLSSIQLDYANKLNEAEKKYKELRNKNKLVEKTDIDDNDIDTIFGTYPTIGTTQFIKLLSRKLEKSGERLYPEFIEENYWTNREILLSKARKSVEDNDGVISKYDIPILFERCSSDFPNALLCEDGTSEKHYYAVHDIEKSEMNAVKTRYEEMWRLLGLSGTAIHDVLSEVFNYGNKYFLNNDIEKVATDIENILSKKNKEDLNWINHLQVKDIIIKGLLLYKYITNKFGKDCYIVPEKAVLADAILPNETVNVNGRLDLLVIDKDGNTHIIDFKVSLRDWEDYNDAKKLTFNYLLNTYAKLLKRLGINLDIKKWIIPIKMTNFTMDENNHLSYNKISIIEDSPLLELEEIANVHKVLDDIFPADLEKDDMSTNEILTAIDNFLSKCFPDYYNYANMTREQVEKLTKDKIILNALTGLWEFNDHGNVITGKTEAECFAKVEEKFRSRNVKVRVSERTKAFKLALILAKKTHRFDFTLELFSKPVNKYGKSTWLQTFFSKYANDRYTILGEEDGIPPQFDELGIIFIKNENNNTMEVLKISKSGYSLKTKNPLYSKTNPRKYLLGTFQSDLISHNSADSLTLESTLGNIELMETMSAINCMPNLMRKYPISEISVLNPDNLDHLTASNKQLLYNFSKLSEFIKSDNNFAYNVTTSSNIRMLSSMLKVINHLNDISRRVKNETGYDRFGSITKNFVSKFDDASMDNLDMLKDLVDLKDSLESTFELTVGTKILSDYSEDINPEIPLYNEVLYAIAELNRIDLVLQIDDHSKWLESSIKDVLKEGINGSYTDNPGTLKSDTLNKLALITEQAYLNARVDLLKKGEEIHEEVEELKEDRSFGWVEKVTIGNQANLYRNMYLLDRKDDLLFKNPFTQTEGMSSIEIKFLKKTLIDILSRRSGFNVHDEATLELAISELGDLALLVPLMLANTASQRAYGGWLHTIKNRLSRLLPSKIKETIKEELLGFFKNEDLATKVKERECYEMTNSFERGFNPQHRSEMLAKHLNSNKTLDFSYWEHNLERLRLNYNGACIMKEKLDKVFPTLKAIVMHLKFSAFIQNDDFPKDIDYALDYIKNKIFNLPIDDIEKWGMFKTYSGMLMSEMSKFTLAFNPKLLYLSIDGLWKDIMLIIQKPDGTLSFTKKNMIDSFMWIVKDVRHFGDKLTLGEYLNQQYGINDLDINSIADKMSNDNAGIHNFWSIGYRFASRPDYYNRMTIFGALMREDGTFEAYELDSKGYWRYNFKKDKRFLHLIHQDYNHPDYKKEEALYRKMWLDFVSEGAVDKNGNKLIEKIDLKNLKDLPRAYTTRLSESMKALGDKIYGYYSHEKRSMILAYSLGALIMHMNTFWSSKKNQYLSGRTFTQLGKYVQYEEPELDGKGEPITDENGNTKSVKFWLIDNGDGTLKIVSDKEITDPNLAKIPYLVWKGRPQEGIIVTLSNLFKTAFSNDENEWDLTSNKLGLILNPHSEYWRTLDPDLKVLYLANLKLLLYDLFMLLILGCLIAPSLLNGAKSYAKEIGNDTLDKAFSNNCLVTLASMLDTSTDDFNWVKSIGGRGIEWTPFSIGLANRVVLNFVKVMEGTVDPYDSLVNTFGASRSNRLLLDWVKLEMFDTPLGTNMNKES